MQPMIQTDALSFSYPVEEGQRRTTALDNVTLSIEKGSFVVVLGHNGSGKSTLAKHMNAVLLPSGGAVYVEGMDTKKEELLLEIRRRVGRTRITRSWPTWWRRMLPSPRRTWGSPRRRSAVGWTTPWRRWA